MSGTRTCPPWVWPASVSATRVGHLRENIGLVHQQHDRIVGVDARQRPGQIVDAAEAAMAERMGELVAEAGQPERVAGLAAAARPRSPAPGCRRRQARARTPSMSYHQS